MATPQSSHAGSVLPEMESTLVQRTTDSSFVGQHYANLGQTAAEQVERAIVLKVKQKEMEKFMFRTTHYWSGGRRVWLTEKGEETLKKVMGKTKYTTSQYGPHEIRVHIKGNMFRMVMSEFAEYTYFEPKIFGERMMKTVN